MKSLQRTGALSDRARIRPIDPRFPEAGLIEAAAGIIRSGGLVVFPTRSLYGLAADARNPWAVARVFEAKRRRADKPLSILIPHLDMLSELVSGVPDPARRVMDRFWPGGITLIFYAAPGLEPNLGGNRHTIGIRLPAHPVASALARATGTIITATSANVSGQPGIRRISDISQSVADAAGLVLDAGELEAGPGSTVLDTTLDPPKILREGTISRRRLKTVLPLLA